MRRIVLFSVACLFAAHVAFGQGAITPTQTTAPPPATATTTGSATGTQPPGQQDPCSRQVVIYIDLSGTMIKAAPNQPDPNLVPLNFIASTLLKFVTNPEFLAPKDEVALKFFGAYVKTKAENREEIIALLRQLAGSTTWKTAIANDRGTFLEKTDFTRTFGDVENRVANSEAAQQIIFIASDFAEDPVSSQRTPSPQVRLQTFGEARTILQSVLNSTSRGRRTQIVGIAAPTPTTEGDRIVSAQVRELLRQDGVRTYDFNEDADEAARTLWNAFVEPIRSTPADGNVVRIGGDQSIAVRLQNANCAEVQIAGVQFGGASKTIDVTFAEPVRLSNGSTDTRVSVERLASLWNSEVDVTPILVPGSTARAETSSRFWLGDWIRMSSPEAHAYPRNLSRGDLLVTANVERSLRSPSVVTIRGAESGGRGTEFVVPRGYTNEPMTFRFPMVSSRPDAFRSGLTLTMTAGGMRLVADDASPLPQIALSVPTPITTWVAKWVEIVQGITTVLIIYLLFVIFLRRAAQDRDEKGRHAVSSVAKRLLPLLVPFTTTSLLSVKYGFVPLTDNWIAGVAVFRAVLVALGTYVVISQLFYQGGLWRALEPKLLDNEDAVFRRKVAYAIVFVLSIAAFLSIVGAFWGPLAAAPPSISRLLTGALR